MRSLSAASTAVLYVRRFSTSPVLCALERVDVLRPHGGSHASSVNFYGSPSSSSFLHSRGRQGTASATTRGGGRSAEHVTVSPLEAVAEDLASFDADDHSGPPATRVNSLRAPRLSFPGLSPESFYFRRTLNSAPGDADDDGTTRHSSHDSFAFEREERPAGRRALPFCRLCREELEPPVGPRLHMLASNRASHLNHSCREIVLDNLSLLALRGFPIDEMEMVWSQLLYDCPHLPRVPALISRTAPLAERADTLFRHLSLLKDLNILDISLASATSESEAATGVAHRRRLAFERLEYLGDNAWGDNISSRIMLLFPDQRWAYSEGSSAFNLFRDTLEMNVTLSFLYDRLRFANLLPASARLSKLVSKGKADVVEAVLGELQVTLWGMVPMLYTDAPFVEVNGHHEKWQVALVQHCLTEIYDLLVLFQVVELSHTAVPLAKDIAAYHLWSAVQPAVQMQKALTVRRTASQTLTSRKAAVSVPVAPFWPPSLPSSSCVLTAAASAEVAMGSVEQLFAQGDVTQGQESTGTTASTAPATHASNNSLALAALTARRRARFTLPATPSLHASPQPRPDILNAESPLLSLGIDEIPEDTVLRPCPNTPEIKRDVFANHRNAFHALDLLNAARLFAPAMWERCQPLWRSWATALVPSTELSSLAAEDDPQKSQLDTSELAEGLGHRTPQLGARTSSALTEAPQYFRDARLDLSAAPSSSSSFDVSGMLAPSCVSTMDMSQLLRVALENAPPQALASEPSQALTGADDAGTDDADTAEAVFSHYARSCYVPLTVKPPLGGVLTERNTCPGTFAFLSAGDAPWETLLAPATTTTTTTDVVEAERKRAATLWASENAFFPQRLVPFRGVRPQSTLASSSLDAPPFATATAAANP